jgi:hypothetical protein
LVPVEDRDDEERSTCWHFPIELEAMEMRMHRKYINEGLPPACGSSQVTDNWVCPPLRGQDNVQESISPI